MSKITNRELNEVFLSFKYQNKNINCVFNSDFDINNKKVFILVPGLFGDRTDSRHMLVRLARRLAGIDCNVLRFDYLGGGSSEGDYSQNDFSIMADTLKSVISEVIKRFPWISEVGLIAFSEGGKLCVKVSKEMESVTFIGFCNAILVEEESINSISRPKIKNNRLVYDSFFGTWISWSIVEEYKKWYISKDDLRNGIVYCAVYSDSDPLTANSLQFLRDNEIFCDTIHGADHLFTKSSWLNQMIDKWEGSISKYCERPKRREQEFFIRTECGKVCTRIIDAQKNKTVIFVHGLGQNKSGPGFLYSQISSAIDTCNMVFFDLYCSGDSDYDEERFSSITLDDFIKQLSIIIETFSNFFDTDNIVLIGSGIGCTIIQQYLKRDMRNLEYILIFPQSSKIWTLLDESDKKEKLLDTHYIYEKYEWAEDEFHKMGNISNRIRGMNIPNEFLLELHTESSKIKCGNGIIFGASGSSNYTLLPLDDESKLLMSAKIRDQAIDRIKAFLENKL